ncbi:MotB-like transcriptional regulator [Salmonella phage vB_SnwM_CGG4-1]|uniref:KOW domain-containing protein n=1 Tax=Salmonella phage vB_SnwM_CGG4-1 TaxID=1815631 RepID=A0A1B0VV87_9CAUD|nr:MotB-like transcriptional regulator [Salmonella phage vB_SnwM_CGG4-1]ANA49365.1 hypothetical protein CGG41_011 [Salmonella phage vB_SnwM_CGG4-1]
MFAKGAELRVISGKNAGRVGIVLGHSKRDGYRLRDVKTNKTIYVKDYYVSENDTYTKEASQGYVIKIGDIVRIRNADAAIEHSGGQGDYRICDRKCGLVTLVYGVDGEEVANVVYQGEYALMATKDLDLVIPAEIRSTSFLKVKV